AAARAPGVRGVPGAGWGRPGAPPAPADGGGAGPGGVPVWPPGPAPPASPSAAETIVALARAHAERLTLIALGPLTNLALALRLDADALRRIARVVMMAGAVDVPGNITPDAEFNAYVDPEAASEVFDARRGVDLVPRAATRQTTINRDQLHAALAPRPGPLADRIAACTEQTFRLWGYMHLHDPLAVALAVDPSLAQWRPARIVVGESGQTRRAAGAPNCRVAHVIDAERFLALFFDRLCPALSEPAPPTSTSASCDRDCRRRAKP